MPGTVLGFSQKISSIFCTLLQSREDSPLSINGETEALNGKITCPSPCVWEWDQVCWLRVFGSSHYIIFPWRESDIFLWFTENKKEHKNKQIWRGEEGSCRCFCHFLCVLITQNQTSQALGSKSEAKRGSRGGKGSRNTSEVRCSRKPAGKKERTLLNS